MDSEMHLRIRSPGVLQSRLLRKHESSPAGGPVVEVHVELSVNVPVIENRLSVLPDTEPDAPFQE